jgi:hypothetical protein
LAGAEFNDVGCCDSTVLKGHRGYSLQLVEADAASGARVQVQDCARLFDEGAMAVAEGDYLRAILRARFRELVDEMEAHTAEFEILAELEAEAAELLVVVSVDGVQRSHASERLKDVRAPDVASMDDCIDVAKGGGEPRINVTVGVGDEADQHGEA